MKPTLRSVLLPLLVSIGKVIFDTLSLVVTSYHPPPPPTQFDPHFEISETKLFLMKIDVDVDVDDVDVMFMLC